MVVAKARSPLDSVVGAKALSPFGSLVGAKARFPRSTSEFGHHGFVVAAKAGHSPVGSVVVAEAIPDQVVRYRHDAALEMVSSASDPVADFPSRISMGHSLPRQDKTMPTNPIDGFELPRELGHGLLGAKRS